MFYFVKCVCICAMFLEKGFNASAKSMDPGQALPRLTRLKSFCYKLILRMSKDNSIS